jgi:hypothetical protein
MTQKLTHEDSFVTAEGFQISRGDMIRVRGEYGIQFKFWSLTTNQASGSVWVDCFEVFRGRAGAFRSFRIDRIKRIPQRGKRAKRVV